MEIKRGVEQVRKGQIPFDDGPGFLESLWTKSKDLGSKLNPTKIWRGSGKTTSNGSPQDQPADPPTAPSPA
ncbi:MAG: hypothetical protein GWN58_31775 [Anaerolineae bacterium]|nr:hypothetical protein [Anaerolineae bacterium]